MPAAGPPDLGPGPPRGPPPVPTLADPSGALTLDQKRTLYREGYVIIKNAVSKELVAAAKRRIKAAKRGENLGPDPAVTDLINKSSITPILTEAIGAFDPPIYAQVGVNPIRKPGAHFNNLGYRDRDQPYYNAEMHIDGSMTIGVPQKPQTGTNEEIYRRYIASGPRGDLGRSPDVIGHNMGPLFDDPAMTLSLGSFTAFVFVCLNDQRRPGCGQTALLRGAHHPIEKFFRWQRAQGGVMGPEGPGWPRLDYNAPNRCGLVYMPESVRSLFLDPDESQGRTPDGKRWPKPTQILMDEGDAAVTIYQIPHSGTRNELGTESRKNIIFRIRAKKRQPGKVHNGVTDHPDRGPAGAWLQFEEGNDPWERSKHAMCNMWHEWDGMRDVVAAEQASGARPRL